MEAPETPAIPKPSGTAVLIRDGRAGLEVLLLHRADKAAHGDWVFPGADGSRPFDSAWAATKARRAWESAGLAPLGLHECRHSYAAYAIAAGINPKALSSYMGHSSITVTLDRYGHLLPGNEGEAAQMLDGYLHRQNPPRPNRFARADHSDIDRPP